MRRMLIDLVLVLAIGVLALRLPVSQADAAPSLADVIAKGELSVVRIHTESAMGSGVVVDAEGHILTNAHVVAGQVTVWVGLSDGRWLDGRVVAVDGLNDLAVVSVEGAGLVPFAIGRSADMRPGDDVVAIGYALGLKGEPTVTKGIISAKRATAPVYLPNNPKDIKVSPVPVTNDLPYLQFDAATNPGGSGGALIDREGRLIGLCTSVIRVVAGGTPVEGIQLAIPIDEAMVLAAHMMAEAKVSFSPACTPTPGPTRSTVFWPSGAGDIR